MISCVLFWSCIISRHLSPPLVASHGLSWSLGFLLCIGVFDMWSGFCVNYNADTVQTSGYRSSAAATFLPTICLWRQLVFFSEASRVWDLAKWFRWQRSSQNKVGMGYSSAIKTRTSHLAQLLGQMVSSEVTLRIAIMPVHPQTH